MCRLFGFRSVINSQVHTSLVSADNALAFQSNRHPDGWGVAYYVGDSPHIIKSAATAINCNIFHQVSGVVSSNTVIAHLRNATLGTNNILNTHPFQFGKWVFAHNGNIKNFSKYRDKIFDSISEELRHFVLGQTDSELIFYFILTKIQEKYSLHLDHYEYLDIKQKIQEALNELVQLVGNFAPHDSCGEDETYFTFILTNGKFMIAHQGGKDLYYSTYKTKCPEASTCTFYNPECENKVTSGKVNHLIFSSEPLSGENVWEPIKRGHLIGVDSQMIIHID